MMYKDIIHNKHWIRIWKQSALQKNVLLYKFIEQSFCNKVLYYILCNVESIDVVVIKSNTVCVIYVNDTK